MTRVGLAPDRELDLEEERPLVRDEGQEPSRADLLRQAIVTTYSLDSIGDPEALVDKILYRDSLAWIYGGPGACKTFIALDMAGCVATEQNWQGFPTRITGPVLYVVAEGVTGVKQRVRAWEAAMGARMENVYFLPVAVQTSNAAEWAALIEVATELRPVLIIIDTQARCTVGMEENSATDMGQMVHRLEALRRATRACVLTIHHTGRGGEHMRGSIAMDGAASTLIKVSKADNEITVECSKQKDGPEFDRLNLRLVPYDASVIIVATQGVGASILDSAAVKTMVSEWWKFFETDWVSASVVTEALCVSRATFFRHIKALVKWGAVETEGERQAKRYRLTKDPAMFWGS